MTIDGVNYTVPLALVDFLPVILSTVGCFLLALLAGRHVPVTRKYALAGAVLVGLGGLCKSVWKLLVAGFQTDLTWLDGLLFPLLGLGFSLLAWSVLSYRKDRPALAWPFIAFVVICFGSALFARSLAPLLGLTALMSLAVSTYALLTGVRRLDWLAAGLFAIQILGTLALVPLASPSHPQTTMLQWTEESINTLAQLCFVLGALRLASWHGRVSREGANFRGAEPIESTIALESPSTSPPNQRSQ